MMSYKTLLSKLIVLFALIQLSSCSDFNQNKKVTKDEYYNANGNFYEISNTILKSKLDSIINSIPYWRLSDYKTTNFGESLAVNFLIQKLISKGLQPQMLIILGIKKGKDSSYTFYLDHVDSYVYRYNWEQTNIELSKIPLPDGGVETKPPITGNLTGYEGWYNVDMESKTLRISYAQ